MKGWWRNECNVHKLKKVQTLSMDYFTKLYIPHPAGLLLLHVAITYVSSMYLDTFREFVATIYRHLESTCTVCRQFTMFKEKIHG